MANWTTWESLKIAAQQAYQSTRVTPQDIDVAQVHDCFAISEIIEYEDLGFYEKGEGGSSRRAGPTSAGSWLQKKKWACRLGFKTSLVHALIDLEGELTLFARVVNVKQGELQEGDEVKLTVFPVDPVPVDGKKGAVILQERVFFAFEKA